VRSVWRSWVDIARFRLVGENSSKEKPLRVRPTGYQRKTSTTSANSGLCSRVPARNANEVRNVGTSPTTTAGIITTR
jgi:hypothetical protein